MKDIERSKKWYKENRDAKRQADMKRRYGLTPNQYDALLEHQEGVCFICQTPPNGKRLAVDHCHESGEVRGLLCGACNRALGSFNDDPIRLNRAIMYLGSKPAALAEPTTQEDSSVPNE